MSDLISRQAAIKAIEDLQDCYNGFSDTYDKACIIGVIEEVPPIEPIKHGWWKNVHISLVDPDGVARYGRWGYECSICGTETAHITPYCPNCGARMDGGESDK